MKHSRTLAVVVALSLFAASTSAASLTTGQAAKGATAQTTPAPKPKAPATTRAAVEVSALPQAVTQAVMKAHPKGTISKATKVTKGSTVTFEVVVKDGTKTSTMVLNDQGKVITPKPKGGI